MVNAQGALRDVDLGAPDGVGDQRTARGQYTNLIVVPYLLDGVEQKVEMVYSRRQFTWAALMKLGGLAADDPRFTAATQHDSANIALDDSLRNPFLQPIDLSSYGTGFNAQSGSVGPVAAALRNDDPDARDPLSTWREKRLPVAYLVERPVKKSVVPVPYVAGIFGSRQENLSANELGAYVWDPDDKKAITKAYAKSLLSAFIQRDWSDAEINDKTQRLHHPGASVMRGHPPEAKADVLKAIKASEFFQRRLHDAGPNTDEDQFAEQEYERRQARGWFGVLSDYVPLFEAIESIEDEHFIYVAFAVGTDWRNDLSNAAEHFKNEIERIQAITDYPELGTKGVHYEAGVHKALVVTHSQGSLIARYTSEVLGANANIQGIVHLNQPTTGAPVLYRRFIGGSRPEREPWYKLSNLPDNVFAEILGTTSYHFTRMAGPIAGALSLLPTNDHMTQIGATPGDWLSAPDSLVSGCGNIYDTYLNDRAGLISHKRYAAQGDPKPYTTDEFTRVRYTRMEHSVFTKRAEPRWYDIPLPQIQDRAAIPPDAKLHLPEETPWHQDNMRLRPHAGMSRKEWDVAEKWYGKFEECLLMAQAFHSDLGLKYHPNTYVIRSNGVNTVTQVRLLLNTDKNGDAVLDCPYERTKEGDGTVPLTSQESLIAQGAIPAGSVITKGNVVHADICKHPDAIAQTKDAITKLIEPLRPKNQDRMYVVIPATSTVREDES